MKQLKPCKPQQNTSDWHSISITSCSRARPPVIGCSPHICLNVYMFECLYVHTFWEGCKYWILDIERQTLRCTKTRRTKNNLSSKINFPVTSTTGSKPSLTSYCWTQSLRHFWGGSINNISELDQFIIRAINRGPFHSTVAKAWKLVPTYFSPGWHKVREPGSVLSRKRAITTFLSGKFMTTRSSIVFEDFLSSSIAPQVMPPCFSHKH